MTPPAEVTVATAPRPLAGGEASPARQAVRFAGIVAQLAIVVLVAQGFQIESAAFYRQILPLAVAGFVVNHLLPMRFRPAFFATIGAAGILIVFGVGAGAWLLGLGLALLGLCHLPLDFRQRVLLILLAAVVLMSQRGGWLAAPWPGAIWPIFGSMFMFRLAIYLYDLKHHGPPERAFSFSYFFLLPNIVFPLFPVIDFRTFRRTYYDRDPFDIYEEGVRWIVRGLTHLMLYRVIYQYVVLPPAEVTSTTGIVQYLVGNYGLYLRVSGQFHLSVGLLHLFGFRLPETHRFFYLASSFSDLWRRINIYWKDFMQKMVYLPVFFGLKRHGETAGLVGATIMVVATTWLLHSYQWFWLLGTWLFSATDAAFWAMLGVFLLVNTIREQRWGRARQLGTQRLQARQAWRHSLQTAAMFALMCVLWGFWTSPTVGDFLALLGTWTLRPIDIVVVAATLGTVAGASFLSRRMSLDAPSFQTAPRWWRHPVVTGLLPLILIWSAGEPAIASRLSLRAREVLRDVRIVELNQYDADRLQRGYYESIVGINRFNGELWQLYASAESTSLWELGGTMGRTDALNSELRPLVGLVFKGGHLRTNRWGMRDQEYERAKPPDTRRIAVLGASYVMGSGVDDGQTFEALLESRLNDEMSPRTGTRYEVLNFGVPGYSIAQQAIIMENGRVGGFEPDVVLLVTHPTDIVGLFRYYHEEIQRGRGIPDPEVRRIIDEVGLAENSSDQDVERRLRPYSVTLVQGPLERIVTETQRLDAVPVLALIPLPTDRPRHERRSILFTAATAAGFTIVDMQDVYDGHDEDSLKLNVADRHPNAEGHQVIADRLYTELMSIPSAIRPAREHP